MFSDTNWWYSKPPCSAFQEQQVNLKKILGEFQIGGFSSLFRLFVIREVLLVVKLRDLYILYQNTMVPRRIIFPWKELLIYINFPGCCELLYTPLSGSTQPIWKTSHGSWNPKVHGEICAKSLQPPPIVLGYLHPPGIFIVPFTPPSLLDSRPPPIPLQRCPEDRAVKKNPVPFHLSKLRKFKTFLTLMYDADSHFIASSNIQMPKQKIDSIFHPPKFHQTTKVNWSRGSLPEVNHRKLWCCRPTFSPYQVEQQ